MAESSPHIPPTGLRAGLTATRSNSLASTHSNASSVASSLRRRSRTRTRTLTSTSSTPRKGKSKSRGPVEDDDGHSDSAREDAPPLPPLLISDREDDVVSSSGESLVYSPPPPRRYKPEASSSSRRPMPGPGPAFLSDKPQEAVFRARERAHSSVSARGRDVFVEESLHRGRQARSENGSVRGVKTTARGSSLPRHAFRNVGSTVPSEPLPLTPANLRSNAVRGARRHERQDSLVSYGSSTSSSLYPQSTSTGSHPESSIGPHSLRDQDDDVSSFSPRIFTYNEEEKDAEFDIDDVSYRLRLLVNNSYFLPPAHSKPSPLSLAPPTPPTTKPSSSPGLLGFFGLGKSKSKPVTPPPNLDLPPVLRTTSDSTTASGHAPRPQVRSLPQSPLHQPFTAPHSANPGNRVVVLREKMDDLMTAAKQAEKDIKIKAEVRKATNYSAPPDLGYVEDVIDPTDAVDLPASAQEDAYPFGLQESVGADVLAERLPPSPGLWSMSSGEDTWRKALLHEAVSHSLVNSADNSFSSSTASPQRHHLRPSESSAGSSSFRSSFPEVPSEENATDSTPKAPWIGQRIMEPEAMADEMEVAVGASPVSSVFPSPTSAKSINTVNLGNLSPTSEAAPSSPWKIPVHDLRRAETPAMAQALAPPPRKALSAHSHSQTDLPMRDSSGSVGSEHLRVLRKAVSSPRLSPFPQDDMHPMSMTPPPNVLQRLSPAPSTMQLRTVGSVPTFSTSRQTFRSVTGTYSSHYSDDSLSYATPTGDMDDDEPDPRPSMTISIHTDGRESLYEHPSPTASAFQDAVFGSCRTPSPLTRRSHQSFDQSTSTSQDDVAPERNATLSPPPRVSSSMGPTILPPPPRSPAVKPVYRPSMSMSSSTSSLSFKSGRTSHSSTPLPSLGLQEEPEEHEPLHHLPPTQELDTPTSPTTLPYASSPPTSPPPPLPSSPSSSFPATSPSTSLFSQLPLAERRGHPPSLSLRIPTDPDAFSPQIHSAPAPASPTAFFDRIQSHPNAMDDLETSDESDEEEGKDEDGPESSGSAQYARSPPTAFRPPYAEPARMRAMSGGAVTFPSGSSVSSRPCIMRLGNHSTPHLSPSSGSGSDNVPPAIPVLPLSSAFTVLDRSKPIGNTPEAPQPTFFASARKKGRGDFALTQLRDAQNSKVSLALSSGSGPHTGGSSPLRVTAAAAPVASNSGASEGKGTRSRSSSKRRPATADPSSQQQQQGQRTPPPKVYQRESLQRFDGMLLQHMAAERDTIKRITTNIQGSSPSRD
ncbi:hypothetical protein EIP91_008271 [Steccherinum ochraceum]|uniref:Uncharacterized protein n=1 Tax=Steccherinum ochraceum TaxID=92696 RepID=A0A4R0R5T4_9APHY|nr:hypothetical protein EIP91_008271 [Steccherinum ochraceum]